MPMFRDLVLKTRSIRRFDEDVAIERETLRELVDLTTPLRGGISNRSSTSCRRNLGRTG